LSPAGGRTSCSVFRGCRNPAIMDAWRPPSSAVIRALCLGLRVKRRDAASTLPSPTAITPPVPLMPQFAPWQRGLLQAPLSLSTPLQKTPAHAICGSRQCNSSSVVSFLAGHAAYVPVVICSDQPRTSQITDNTEHSPAGPKKSGKRESAPIGAEVTIWQRLCTPDTPSSPKTVCRHSCQPWPYATP